MLCEYINKLTEEVKARFVNEEVGFKRGLDTKDVLEIGYVGLETFREMARKHGYELLKFPNPAKKHYPDDNEWGEFQKFTNLETWHKEIEDSEQIYIDIIHKENTIPKEIFLNIDLPKIERRYDIQECFTDQWWHNIEEEGNKI